jgi:hypothetical protein
MAPAMIACGGDWLPADAAPFLSFKQAAAPAPLWEVWGSPADWSAADRERLAPYRMIGSDGSGNPMCFEHETGAVVLLDHENEFRSRQFVNSSVGQLAECLLAYMGEREPELFTRAVQGIDAAALADGSFWWYEAAGVGDDE